MAETTKIRLSPSEYEALEKKLPTINPTPTTTPEQYAYWCGIQAVLKHLRDGFTIGVS